MRDKARQNAAELAKKVAQVDIEVPPTARVSVDGKPLEETGATGNNGAKGLDADILPL
jgi:hypothetical protein